MEMTIIAPIFFCLLENIILTDKYALLTYNDYEREDIFNLA